MNKFTDPPRYPELANSKLIVLDIETYDPNLLELGAGVYRNDGYILGVSVATDTGFSEYYNLGHADCTQQERTTNIAYLRAILASDTPKLGANILYDVDWLENWRGISGERSFMKRGVQIKIGGLLYDTQTAEALLDENQLSYSLETLANKYLSVGKVKALPQEYCDSHNMKGDFRKWLHKMPYVLVREYAMGDVTEPLAIFEQQWKLMEEQELLPVFNMETKLTRALLHMRKTGANVNPRKRDINAYMAHCEREKKEIALDAKYGKINLNSTKQLAELFDKIGVEYNYNITYINSKGMKIKKKITSTQAKQVFIYVGGDRTEDVVKVVHSITEGCPNIIRTCNPTIDKEFLEGLEREIDDMDISDGASDIKDILFVRKADKIVNSFLKGSMVDTLCNDGRIHPAIHATRSDDGGTRTGRLSMSKPNLQQIPSPSRNKYWGTLCRECFVPNPNSWWAKIDYSQIEYRVLAHYASGEGADELRNKYNEDEHTDYHQYIMDLTSLSRSFAKILNFGCMYGMSKKTMSTYFKWSMDYATEVLNVYHGNAPYIKYTMNRVGTVAKARGYIKTIAGRRSHLVSIDKAYKMLNSLIQGSAADAMKKALLDIFNSGLLDIVQWHVTVHDEIDFSVPKTAKGLRAIFAIQKIMEMVYPLKVPIKAELEMGADWGHLNLVDFADIAINKNEWLAGLTDENCEAELQRVVDACKVVEAEKERIKNEAKGV